MTLDGSGTELRTIVEVHGAAVFALAVRLTRDRAAAEEITQDVFMELWRTRPVFASTEHMRFWLRRVAAHRATDYLRKCARRPWLVVDEQIDHEPESRNQAQDAMPSGLATRLEGLIQSLPEQLRVAVVLRYGEDEMTPEEIALLLGQPTATVKSNLQRALAMLRRKAGITLKEFMRHG